MHRDPEWRYSEEWSDRDCAQHAADSLRFLLKMGDMPHQLKLVLGPENYRRALILLDVVETYINSTPADAEVASDNESCVAEFGTTCGAVNCPHCEEAKT